MFNATFTTADVATVVNTSGLDVPPFNAIPVFGPGNANSTADYFHPSIEGQAVLADAAWSATFRELGEPKGGRPPVGIARLGDRIARGSKASGDRSTTLIREQRTARWGSR